SGEPARKPGRICGLCYREVETETFCRMIPLRRFSQGIPDSIRLLNFLRQAQSHHIANPVMTGVSYDSLHNEHSQLYLSERSLRCRCLGTLPESQKKQKRGTETFSKSSEVSRETSIKSIA
ncbi:MAG TPA: hypothetical protein VG848_07590, partial [Acetobacteraceae bacterium]|nr:hypothetical protein [Acetobacteraceae bacterium]